MTQAARPVAGGGAALGAVLVVLSAVAWSTAGVFTKAIDAGAWTILFWRGIVSAIFIFAYVAWREERPPWQVLAALNGPGWGVATVGALATLCFLPALKLTSVANVAIIYATVPFVAAGLGWLWMREKISMPMLAASSICLIGVAIMVGGSAGTVSFRGDGLALLMTVLFAVMTVLIRRFPESPTVLAACVGSLQVAAVSWTFAEPMSLTAQDMVLLLAFAGVQAAGIVLFTEGARLVPAGHTALLSAAEVPLSPLWAWVVLSEVPPHATFMGGAWFSPRSAGISRNRADGRRVPSADRRKLLPFPGWALYTGAHVHDHRAPRQ